MRPKHLRNPNLVEAGETAHLPPMTCPLSSSGNAMCAASMSSLLFSIRAPVPSPPPEPAFFTSAARLSCGIPARMIAASQAFPGLGIATLYQHAIVVSVKSRVPPDAPQTLATAYDAFAFAYNAYWGPVGLSWLRWLSVLAIPRLASRARVLDLCCGTGQLVAELSRRGFRMVGLDGSRAMLRYARANADGVPLVQADVRQFGMREHFDAVLCLFDSLNHLLAVEELNAAFRSVFRCLRPGGWFLFDVNTAHGYALHWNGRREMAAEEHVVRTWSDYDVDRRLGVFRATIRRLGSTGWTEEEVTLWQRCHGDEEIRSALADAGFSTIEAYGIEQDALVAGSVERSERAFYLCRRSPGIRRRQTVPRRGAAQADSGRAA